MLIPPNDPRLKGGTLQKLRGMLQDVADKRSAGAKSNPSAPVILDITGPIAPPPRRSPNEPFPPAPGEVPRGSSAQAAWIVAALAVLALVAAASTPSLAPLRAQVQAQFAQMTSQGTDTQAPRPLPPPRAVQLPGPGKPPASTGGDDRARPLKFYVGRWTVEEKLSPIGWTKRVEISTSAQGQLKARVWITCPTGTCEAGEYQVTPAAHLQKKDQTAFISIVRIEAADDRVWTLLLRAAPGRPDELERWEWYGTRNSTARIQDQMGHVRRER
jgi:hypothetical protein